MGKAPRAARDDAERRIRGAESPSDGAVSPGELILTLKIKPHPIFRREGEHDVAVDLPLTIVEATLGAKVKVPTLDGSAQLTIPPGTSSGQRLRLKGQGAGANAKAGDLYAVIRIVAPKNLAGADRDTLADLGKKLPSPRTGPGWE